jgi:repressor of nif and glnA expression
MEISERTVRLYLQELDDLGMTENLGRRGGCRAASYVEYREGETLLMIYKSVSA